MCSGIHPVSALHVPVNLAYHNQLQSKTYYRSMLEFLYEIRGEITSILVKK